MKRAKPDVKRIQVTVEITVPALWTIGETERWLMSVMRWASPIVGEQRLVKQ